MILERILPLDKKGSRGRSESYLHLQPIHPLFVQRQNALQNHLCLPYRFGNGLLLCQLPGRKGKMRSKIISACLIGLATASCSVSSPEEKAKASDDKNFQAECVAALEEQIAIEFQASLQYLLMAAHFSQDTVNLPKVAALFWGHADEE